MSALELALLRACGAAAIGNPDLLAHAAANIGRRPARAGGRTILARHPDAPTPTDLEVQTLRLAPSALVALGLCLGLTWADREQHPYPGIAVAVADLAAAARDTGLEVAAVRHVIGAARHILCQAGLIEVEGEQIRLGPAIAGWSDADLETLRRNLEAFPAPAGGAA